MPSPIAAFPFDNNSMEIIQKVRAYKKILVPNESLEFKDATDNNEHKAIWQRFKSLYYDAINSASVRSIFLDTGSDLYELCRLALLGRLEQVPPHFYGKVNVEFTDLIRKVQQSDKNLAIIHRLKDEYVKGGVKGEGVRTGKRILSGIADIKYKVQLDLISWRDLDLRNEETGSEGFGVTIENCSQNEKLAGTYLEEPDNTWAGIGTRVYPNTTVSDWE
jgi:hypothetical protein